MFVINGYNLTNQNITGIHRNTIELLKALDKIAEKNEVSLIVTDDCKIDFNFQNIKVVQIKATHNPLLLKGRSFIWNNFKFHRYVKKHKAISIDMLLNFPLMSHDVITVYDCILENFPNYSTDKNVIKWRTKFLKKEKRAINKAKIILTDSYSAKSDIEKNYPKSKNKIVVIYCGWQHFNNIVEDDSILDKYNLKKGNYFFSLGSKLVHKNAKWIVEAAKQNPNEFFVLTGLETVVDDGREHLPNVIYTGYLTDGEIKALMHNCKAFIQPSLYEGFGLPPIEAMSVGAKCIVSNVTSLPEIYGDSVWYIDPYKYDDIDLEKIMSKKVKSNEDVLNKFSWDKSATQLKQILYELDNKIKTK